MSETLPVAVTRMTFDDEFNTFVSSEDGSTGWMTSLPYGGEAAYTLAGNNEAEFYGSSTIGENPFSLSNGVLSITATPANGTNAYGLPYNSGVINTINSFSQTYGYFEVNAELPAGQGLWPAFWMLPANGAYTSELDIFEQLGNDPSQIQGNVHGTTNGTWGSDPQTFEVANTSTSFNTYGVDWEPTTTTFYMNGVELGSVPTPTSMNNPMYLLLNLAVGGAGSWPGAAAATSIPATMQINYVRAYATAATNYVGGSDAIPVGAAAAVVPPSSPVPTTPVVVGSGPDTLALNISEDAYLGNAQFTVSINGVQQGGTLTATVSDLAPYTPLLAQSQVFDIEGNFAGGTNVVTVDFLNDLYGGSATMDRDLYVLGAQIDGVAVANSALNEAAAGSRSFSFSDPAAATSTTPVTPVVVSNTPSASTTVVVGSGPDTLALTVSEDAYLGNAQFTVSIDGVQQGGTLTATVSDLAPYTPLAAQSQVFDIEGSFATGANVVTVNFLNDLYGGSATMDRNLYVLGAVINGAAVANSALNEAGGGAQSFTMTVPASTATAASTTTSTSAATVIGSGSDTLALNISEDAYLGNAQFTVSINGVQQGGTLTADVTDLAPYTPLLAQSQVFDIEGSFAAGSDVVTVDFLNDLYGGSATMDRDLYVLGAAINGVAVANSALNEAGAGSQSFTMTVPATTTVTSSVVATSTATTTGPLQTLSLGVAETASNGNAQYQVTVDGVDAGGVQTASASEALGQSAVVMLTGNWGNGAHTVGVTLLNPAAISTAAVPGELFVNGVTLDGNVATGAPATLLTGATQYFQTPVVTASALSLNLSEDAYLGNALFSVSVDGTQIGSSQSVTASHALGATEAFNFANVLSVGTHDIAISFLNDAYGGSAALDRNLYVNSISVAGTTVASSSAALYSNSTTHFSVVVANVM